MVGSRQVTIEFLGNSRDLSQAIDSAERSTGSLSRTMGKVGRAAALGFAAAAVVVGKGLFEAAQAAVEDEASQKKLANTLKQATGATDEQIASTEDFITKTSLASGVADDELRPALSALAIATGDVAEAQDLTSLAMDVAAGKGKSLQSVADALAKAQNGNVGALGRLGIATKDAEGKTKSFAEIQDDLAKKFKGASATAADTMEGKMGRLKVAFNETMEEIGYKLLPVLTDLATWFLDKGLPAIQNFGGWMQNNLVPVFKDIGEVIGNVFGGGTSGKISENLTKIRETIATIVETIRLLWNQFGADIIAYTGQAFGNLMTIIGGVLDMIRGIFQVFTALFQGDWTAVGEALKLIWSGALTAILGILQASMDLMKLAMDIAWAAIKALAETAWGGIKTLVKNAIDDTVGWVQDIPSRFSTALSTLSATVSSLFDTAMTAGKNKVENIGATIVGWITGIPGKLGELAPDFKTVGGALITAFINGLSATAGFVSNIAGNVWDALKGMINAAIDSINSALSFSFDTHVPGVGTVSVNPPDIPHLAKGGIVTRPTLALIGEDGPEAVVPLGAKNAPRGKLALGGGASTVVQINLQSLDPRGAGKAVMAALREYEQMYNVKVLVAPR